MSNGEHPPGSPAEDHPMTDVDNLVLEHLRAIRADLADLKREMVSNTLQLAALGQQVAGLTTAVYGGKSELEALKRRIEHIERRLELISE